MSAPSPGAMLPVAGSAAAWRSARAALRPHRAALVAVIAVVLAATGLALVGPVLLGLAVDDAIGGRTDRVVLLAGVYLAATAAAAAFSALAAVRVAGLGEHVLQGLRTTAFRQALRVPLDRLERVGTGDLTSRVTADVATLTDAVRWALPTLVVAAAELVLTVGALALLSPWLLLPLLAAVPVVAAGTAWYAPRATARYGAIRRRVADVQTQLTEASDGRSTLLAFGQGQRIARRLRAAADGAYDAELHAARARNVLRPAVSAGQAVALAATVVLGAWLVGSGRATLGVVTAAALYQLRLFEPVSDVLEMLDELQSASAAHRRLAGIAEVTEPVVSPRARPTAPTLSCRGVRFAYGDGPLVLNGLDLDVAAGERVAVVGPSGAGKSTVLKLLAGVHDPIAGRVQIGGVDVADIGDALHEHVVLVTQETHVFRGPLAEDLRAVAPCVTDAELLEVLGTVGADTWVARLPEGLATVVGAGGFRLGPAQEQQLALARVLLRDPPVVLLDEATGAMDPAAARRFDRGIDAAVRGRTVLSVTHRLASAATADRIAVLEAGRITEVGTHEDLLDRDGSYARLWRRWTEATP